MLATPATPHPLFLFALVTLAACGSTTVTVGPDATAPDRTLVEESPAAETGPLCFVDFPCFGQRFACSGASTYRAVVTHDCSYRCSQPCSGGSCDPDGPTLECPAGTRCVDRTASDLRGASDPRSSPCEAADGGAPRDADVAADASGCLLPPNAASCVADDECATVARRCYCGQQPVEGVHRRFAETAAVCEELAGQRCLLGCAVFEGRQAQDGRSDVDGGVIAVRCERDGGAGRCVTWVR